MMKRFFVSLLLLCAVLTGGAHAQRNSVKSILFTNASSCPASVRQGLPSGVPCPKVDFNPATGTAWVQGSGFVPLSSLASITNATGGYVQNWDGSLTWKFGPVTNKNTNFNVNPTNLTNVSKVGDAAAVLTVVSDVAALNAAGINVGNGNVYQLDCSACVSSAQITFGGVSGNTNTHIGSAYVRFSIGNGRLQASGGTGATGTLSGSTYVRSAFFITPGGGSATFQLSVNPGGVGYVIQNQMEELPYATATSPSPVVTIAGSTATSAAQLRVGTGMGLLPEESRQNLVFPSQADNDASWTKGTVTVTADTTVAPDGTLTADTITGNGAANQQYFLSSPAISFTSGTTYTYSRMVKAGTQQWVQMSFGAVAFGGVGYQNFNTQTCTTGTPGGTLVASGAYWVGSYCRIWIAATATASSSVSALFYYASSGTDARAPATVTSTGTVIDWGSQVEAGAFPTSYYPTTTAAGTRALDAVNFTGPLLSAVQGNSYSVFVNGSSIPQGTAGAQLLDISNGGTSSDVGIYRQGGGTNLRFERNGLGNNITIGNPVLAAASANPTTVLISQNGVSGSAVSNASVQVTKGTIGNSRGGSGAAWNNYVPRLSVWASALTQAQLNAITEPRTQPVLSLDFANGSYLYNGYNIGSAGLSSLFSVSNSAKYCTNGAGQLVSISANTLPICSGTGLLPEDTRTNLLTQSNSYGIWTNNGISTTQNLTDPAGVANSGWTITQTGANTTDSRSQKNITVANDSTTYACSIYVLKQLSAPTGYPALTCQLVGGTGILAGIVVDPVSGNGLALNGASLNPTVVSAGAWWRASFMVANNSTGNVTMAYQAYPGWNASFSVTKSTVLGASNGFAFSQEEVGSFPTSYIPTVAVAVTRNFDNIQALGPVLNLLGTQGANSMMAAWTQSQYYTSAGAPSRQYVVGASPSGNSRWNITAADSVQAAPYFVLGDGTTTSVLPASNVTWAVSTPMKLASRWNTASADFAVALNGLATTTAARQFGGVLAPFYIGSAQNSTGVGLNMPLGVLQFFPGGLTNSSLQAATQ